MEESREQVLTRKIVDKFPKLNLHLPLLAQFDSVSSVSFLLELENVTGARINFLKHDLNKESAHSLIQHIVTNSFS